MAESQFPLELVSSFISILILGALFYKYYQYKKKLDVLKGLAELKEEKKLTEEDKDFIKKNIKDYRIQLSNEEIRLKTVYPLFILIAGVLLIYLSFQEAMIHLNIVIVAYIYLHVSRIHTRNFVNFLQQLNTNIEEGQ